MDERMRSQSPEVLESEEPLPDADLREVNPESPEADTIEQHRPAVPDDVDEEPSMFPAEASEADLLEQARVVPIDDEY